MDSGHVQNKQLIKNNSFLPDSKPRCDNSSLVDPQRTGADNTACARRSIPRPSPQSCSASCLVAVSSRWRSCHPSRRSTGHTVWSFECSSWTRDARESCDSAQSPESLWAWASWPWLSVCRNQPEFHNSGRRPWSWRCRSRSRLAATCKSARARGPSRQCPRYALTCSWYLSGRRYRPHCYLWSSSDRSGTRWCSCTSLRSPARPTRPTRNTLQPPTETWLKWLKQRQYDLHFINHGAINYLFACTSFYEIFLIVLDTWILSRWIIFIRFFSFLFFIFLQTRKFPRIVFSRRGVSSEIFSHPIGAPC